MNIPKVKFKVLDKEENINFIFEFINKEDSSNEYFLKLFPTLRGNLSNKELVLNTVSERYDEELKQMKDKALEYQINWDKVNDEFMINLANYLNISWPKKDINAYIGILHICPRCLDTFEFYIHPWANNEQLLTIVMHECCHFLYFEKWKELYPKYNDEDFENPHLIWELSERVVDPILNKVYSSIEHRAYDNFYVDKPYIMNNIKEIYQQNKIEDAIAKSYEYLVKEEENENKDS